jgi:hypothetical protein
MLQNPLISVDDKSDDNYDEEVSKVFVELTLSERKEEVAFTLEKTISSSLEEDIENSDQYFDESLSQVQFFKIFLMKFFWIDNISFQLNSIFWLANFFD